MDGNKALCFVRERHALPSGDFDRGRNQQRLLKAMIIIKQFPLKSSQTIRKFYRR